MIADTLQNMPGLGEVIDVESAFGREHAQFLGGSRKFENRRYGALTGQSSRPRRMEDGAWIGALLMRNLSGGVLQGGRLGRLDTSGTGTGGTGGGELYTEVVGYSNAIAMRTVVLIDPWIIATGVPDGWAFWGIIKGPAPCRTPLDAGNFAENIVVGGGVISADEASGSIDGVLLTPANQADAQRNALGVLGVALEPCEATVENRLVNVFWNIPMFG